jgi:hypothetical protein
VLNEEERKQPNQGFGPKLLPRCNHAEKLQY